MTIVTTFYVLSDAGDLKERAAAMLADADEHPVSDIYYYLDRPDAVAAAVARLASIGLENDLHKPRGTPQRLLVTQSKRWSESDLLAAEYMKAFVPPGKYEAHIDGFNVTQLDGDMRWSLDFEDAKKRVAPWFATWVVEPFSFIVRVDGVEILKSAAMVGYDLLPTRQHVQKKLPGPPQYPQTNPAKFRHLEPAPRHVWFQLFPRLELPKMHPSVLRGHLDETKPSKEPIDRGPGRFYNEGAVGFQPTWYRRDLDSVDPFDIARTYETFYHPPRGSMTIISQRFYQFLRQQKGLFLNFWPVKIVD